MNNSIFVEKNCNFSDFFRFFKLILVCSVSAISLVSYNYGYTNISIICSIIYIIFALLQGTENSFVYILFGLSNSHVLNIFGVSNSVILCCVFSVILFVKEKKIPIFLLFIYLVFLSYSLQFLIRFGDFSSAFLTPIKLFFVSIYFYLYLKTIINSDKIETILYNGLVFSFFAIIINLLISVLMSGSYRGHVLNNDANMLSVECAFFVSIALVLFFRTKLVSTIKLFMIILGLSLCIIITGSRNGLLLLIIIFVVALIFNFKKISKVFAFYSIFLILILLFIYSDIGRSYVNKIISRIDLLVEDDDLSNGRFALWQQYVNLFNSNKVYWLIGFGRFENAGLTYMAHNGFLEDVFEYGMVGLLLIGVSLFYIYLSASRLYKQNIGIFPFFPIFVLLIGSITLRGMTNIINLSLLFYSIMIICYFKRIDINGRFKN